MNNRFQGIAIALVGVIITLLSALKVAPLFGAGGALIFLGLLLFGLSFIPRPDAGDRAPMSVVETLTKIFYAPGEVFANLRHHPRWFAPILIVSILGGIYLNAFYHRLTPERVNNHTIGKLAESGFLPADKIEEIRADSLNQLTNPVTKIGTLVSSFVIQVFMSAFLGLFFFVLVLVFGGRINFWQAFSTAVYAMFPVAVITYLLSLLVLFLKDPVEIHPILGQVSLVTDNLGALVTPSDNPVLYALLSAFGLLAFYRLFLNAVGLKNAGEKVTAGMGWTAAIVLFVGGLVLSTVSALFFGKFIS